ISGNYRLGEFQGAVLNGQLDRLEAQTKKRDRNGQYLAMRLAKFPGIYPKKRPKYCSRHSYHLFMLRMESEQFGAGRVVLLKALGAEGIPCSGGYGFSLTQQPLFRNKAFGPYLPNARGRLDYGNARVPVSDRICRESLWLEQSMFLGTRSDIDDIA